MAAPAESWLLLVLGALSVGLVGAVVGSSGTQDHTTTFAVMATSGYFIGYVLAKTHLADLMAHAISFIFGFFAALVALEPRTMQQSIRAGDFATVYDRYSERLRSFVDSVDSGDAFRDDVAVFAVSLTIWLVGYSAAWMLFRREWLFWSLALPATILLVSLGLDREQEAWPALVYLGLALGMAAIFVTVARTSFWNRKGVEHPGGFGHRSIVAGSLIALLALGIGVLAPLGIHQSIRSAVAQRSTNLAQWIDLQTERLPTNGDSSPSISGNYGSFGEEFRIGEGVPSGDTPIAMLRSNEERYLAARRFGTYDGRGWTAVADGDAARLPPRIEYQPFQPMTIPGDEAQHRVEVGGEITILNPTNQLLFTVAQHYEASELTFVRVTWTDFDETYRLDDVNLASLPTDIRELFALLGNASFSDEMGENGEPAIENQFLATETEREREYLRSNYPIETTISRDSDGEITVHAKGRLPIHQDIEAVFSAKDGVTAPYGVVGLAPNVTADELRGAGIDYPVYISGEYLDLPDSVTDRTRQLARKIVDDAGAVTAFDQAMAIQTFLRTSFGYELDAGLAPAGEDVVDYFLFERQVGRCDHFASSMVVMLRELGVPSRIVTGLAPAPLEPERGGYVYRGRDSHAWVETYFPAYGWIPFEPTPSQSEIGLANEASDEFALPTPVAADAASPNEAADGAEPTPTATPAPAPAAVDVNQPSGGRGAASLIPFVIAVVIGALGAVTLFMVVRWRRHFSGLTPAAGYFARLIRVGSFWGVKNLPFMTPSEYASAYGRVVPGSANAAAQVADAFAREQYGGDLGNENLALAGAAGWGEVKRGLRQWRPWRRAERDSTA